MSVLQRPAYAKVNLTLHITGKRQDGYHLLESLMSFADLHDTVTVEPSNTLGLTITGPFAPLLNTDHEENILSKTAKLLAAKAGRNPDVHITLHKAIPVGAGIGGGSADAAALLHLLEDLWELSFSAEEMRALALSIGADVPICYNSQTALVAGIGEHITPMPFPHQLAAVLVNPLTPLSTIAVFKQGVGQFSSANQHEALPTGKDVLIAWLSARTNDLQAPANRLLPAITDIITAIAQQPSCLLARMSGSGATCFGLFETEEYAAQAARQLRTSHPQWWVQETVIGNP